MAPPSAPSARRAPLAQPLEFANVRLLVRDYEASWRFHRDVLGLTPGLGDLAGPYGEFLWDGEARLGLFDRYRMATAVGRTAESTRSASVGGFALILRTPDVDRIHAELLARGATILQPPTDRKEWRLRTLHVADPDGNAVEIYSDLPTER